MMTIDDAVAKLLPTLNHMRVRPGMWFREGSYMEGFYAFLLGYSVSASDHVDLKVFELGPGFTRWLVEEKELKGESTQPWSEIMRQNALTDEAAFAMSFDLISEYNDWPKIDGDLAKF